MTFSRRTFLAGTAAVICAAAAGVVMQMRKTIRITGRIVGASAERGHAMRFITGLLPSREEETEVVIVGAGVAGLAAARQLKAAGIDDFMILDLEGQIGGNAQGGKNAVSAYPWGAHYVTLAPKEAAEVQKFYEDAGIITGYDANGFSVYNEYYLCADPHDRLFMNGRWQEGILPQTGVADDDARQMEAFHKKMDEFQMARGKDGRRAFVIPVDDSSRDEEFLTLDKLTMKEWMEREGFTAEPLHWFVDYGCRDDYGTTHAETSAWAGIHYFAARNGIAANASSGTVLTWPEGNGFIVEKLAEGFKDKIRTATGAYRVETTPDGVTVYCSGADKYKVKAKAVLLAIPRFVAKHMQEGVSAEGFTYAPWAVANITLAKRPAGSGADIAWDNVVYGSRLLGYVVATHQSLAQVPSKTVITYYWPLTHAAHEIARKELLGMSYESLRDIFLDELFRIHPELKEHVENVDIWRWGHGMIRPVPGFMWGGERLASHKQAPPVFYAHSDMSGISIFEEAYTRGVRVAAEMEKFLKREG